MKDIQPLFGGQFEEKALSMTPPPLRNDWRHLEKQQKINTCYALKKTQDNIIQVSLLDFLWMLEFKKHKENKNA